MTLQPHCCHRKMPSVSSVNHSKSLSKAHDKLFDVSKSLSEIRDNLSDVSKSLSEVHDKLSDISKSLPQVHDNLSDVSKSLSEIRDNLSDVSKRLPQVSEDQFCTQNTHCKLAGTDSSHRTPCRKSASPQPRPRETHSEHSDRATPTRRTGN